MLAGALSGCQSTAAASGTVALAAGPTRVAAGAIDAEAERVMRRMSDFLKGVSSMRVVVENEYDVLEAGLCVQYARRIEMDVRRPDRLAVRADGQQASRRYWFDGEKLALLDVRENAYSVVAAPGGIDAMLDTMNDKYGLSIPIADLLYADPYAALMGEVTAGRYVGLHAVDGAACHHLAFAQQAVDWQIWIDAGEQPLPRKLVVNNKRAPSVPTFVARFTQWDVGRAAPDSDFVFTAPAGAAPVEMLPLQP